ncbi:hypothetical protein CRG98_022429 [Punica granatum]|uniref:Uncharacterized protein n=1 Tax=Punica granatum TaxID=22663 RepID=A0A2I0JLI1_PUNGR|nr:hypothetical protein CRG98_022429 [Punica granatum]
MEINPRIKDEISPWPDTMLLTTASKKLKTLPVSFTSSLEKKKTLTFFPFVHWQPKPPQPSNPTSPQLRCLDELVQNPRVPGADGQLVRSVFHHVDPSQMRKATRIFAAQMAKHVGSTWSIKNTCKNIKGEVRVSSGEASVGSNTSRNSPEGESQTQPPESMEEVPPTPTVLMHNFLIMMLGDWFGFVLELVADNMLRKQRQDVASIVPCESKPCLSDLCKGRPMPCLATLEYVDPGLDWMMPSDVAPGRDWATFRKVAPGHAWATLLSVAI